MGNPIYDITKFDLLSEIDEFVTWAEAARLQQGKASPELLHVLAVGETNLEQVIRERAEAFITDGGMQTVWKRIVDW